jgi:hypothetical protein
MFATDLCSQFNVSLATGEPSIEVKGLLRDPGLPASLLNLRAFLRQAQNERDLRIRKF